MINNVQDLLSMFLEGSDWGRMHPAAARNISLSLAVYLLFVH